MEEIESWAQELDALLERLGKHFVRAEARERARQYLLGLLSPAERKNSWQVAEMVGEQTPYGIQQFLYRAVWDVDAIRDELRRYVVEHLGDEQGVLIVDDTGFLKKGTHSAGVKKQYSGTAGRIENCQIGVFLGYTSQHGHSLIDRELYVPEEWANDQARREQAGIPDEVAFHTKPNLAWQMLQRALAAEVPFTWVTGDSAYGDYRSIRLWLEEQAKHYVIAVSGKESVWLGWQQHRVADVLASLPQEGWTRLSMGEGSKGPRLYEWHRLAVNRPPHEGYQRWLLVRRSLSDPKDQLAYACFAPEETSLETLVQVAGQRWAIESCFEEAKGETGLDHYEVRSWTGWYRHITLACLAHAFLAVLRAQTPEVALPTSKKGLPGQSLTRSSLQKFKTQRGLSSV